MEASVTNDRNRRPSFVETNVSSNPMQRFRRFSGYLLLLIAGLWIVRQSLVDVFEIPTGSMRPTYLEKDHVLVSKTAFGLQWPWSSALAFFDPHLVPRTGVVVWSPNSPEMLEGTGRYIKRVIGKPGDTLYFYGGQIYGIDANGDDITSSFRNEWMDNLHHVPFATFEGLITTATSGNDKLVHRIFLNQMGQPIGRLTLRGYGVVDGTIFAHNDWKDDNPYAQASAHNSIESYSDFWGIRNYAMARILTRQQVEELTPVKAGHLEDALLYLELRHTPSLAFPKPRFQEAPDGRIRFLLSPHVAVIPLKESHISRLMGSMTTSRFVVEEGRASLYQPAGSSIGPNSPLFSTIEDGIYEFIQGNAYKISPSGTPTLLIRDHPLYKQTASNVQRLFNLGIEFDTDYSPTKPNQVDFPARYAYFRSGDLWVSGAPIFYRTDPTLQHFNTLEEKRARSAPSNSPYIAFQDYGPPIKQGKLDKRFIKNFGIKVPNDQLLLLGDNASRSVDSRTYGFAPINSLQGAPTVLLWPFNSRWGRLPGPPTPWATVPHTITLALLWILCALPYGYRRWREGKRILQQQSQE